MLKIRFTRTGKKKQPNYRIVVAEHSSPIQGKFIEIVGNYNPFTKKAVIEKDKIMEWMAKGAKPSNTVAKLLEKEGLKHPSIVIQKFRSKSKKELEAEKKEKEEQKAKEDAEKANNQKEIVIEKDKDTKNDQADKEGQDTETPSSENGRPAGDEKKEDMKTE